ncbi:MAG: SDR family NAD(P)-dependent oxidoreductase [Luteolibacter sp.]
MAPIHTAEPEVHVVTGASSGIGRSMALQLAGPGREIWLIGRSLDALNEVASEVEKRGAIPRIQALDLTETQASQQFLDLTFPEGKRVHSLYLVAGISLFGEVKDTLLEDWRDLYATNLLSPVQWTHHFYKHMVKERAGRIVLVASLASYAGYPTATVYATMKAGLLGLYRSLKYEGEARGVKIHLMAPGYVDTEIYQRAGYRKTNYDDTLEVINSLGFGMISADRAASKILRAVDDGKTEYAFPPYAGLMKWIAPRMPWVVGIVHRQMLGHFRKHHENS